LDGLEEESGANLDGRRQGGSSIDADERLWYVRVTEAAPNAVRRFGQSGATAATLKWLLVPSL
jgi:hypothetical protein